MNIILIVFLTLLNALFAMSEMALASSRKARLAALAEAGDKGAHSALDLLEKPTQFLSTVQVGITSIGMLNGIVGEAAFSDDLASLLRQWGMSEGPAGFTATATVVTAITFVTIIFGELVPKRIGQMYPEIVACWMSRPMAMLARMAGPFVRLLTTATQGVLRLMRINSQSGQEVTEEEITASLAEGVTAGLIEAQEHQMVHNVFGLDERPLTSIMTARADVVWLEASLTPEQALACIRALPVHEQHSWYPVCRDGLAHVLGVIGLTQLLGAPAGELRSIEHWAKPADFVPETLTGMELLERLKDENGRLVFVVDEYGDVQGLVTPLDLLEAITGELMPETETQAWATPCTDGSWLLDGLMPVTELQARLDILQLPALDRGRYNTLGGLILFVLGRLPQVSEKIRLDNWEFEVLKMDGRRVDKIMAHPISSGRQP